MIGIEGGETIEEGSPVVAAPVLGLDLGAYADGEDGMAFGWREDFFCAGVFCFGEVEVPACRSFEMSVSQLRQIACETLSFGLEGLLRLLPAIVLHVLCEGNSDEAGDSAEAKESGVATGGIDSASRAHVDEDLRTPAAELPPETEEFAGIARTGGVAEITVDEVGVLEDRGCGRGFDVDGEVRQEAALGVGKGAGDEVEGRHCNEGVAEAA